MNERIKQLSDIAYQNHLKNNPHSSFGRRGDYDREFAELIVRECARVCSDVGVALSAEPAQNNFGTAQTCKMAIEKHLGVEE